MGHDTLALVTYLEYLHLRRMDAFTSWNFLNGFYIQHKLLYISCMFAYLLWSDITEGGGDCSNDGG